MKKTILIIYLLITIILCCIGISVILHAIFNNYNNGDLLVWGFVVTIFIVANIMMGLLENIWKNYEKF